MDYVTFERRLLHLMFRTNAPLSPVHVAYYLDLPIAEARAHLDHLVEQGVLELDSDDAGHIVYTCPMRPPLEKLGAPKRIRRKKKRRGAAAEQAQPAPAPQQAQPEPRTPASPQLSLALPPGPGLPAPVLPSPSSISTRAGGDPQYELIMVDGRRYYSPAAAAALSLFLPGVGQIYTGRVPQGIGWMLATGMGYLLFLIPGLILHICCVVNAAAVPARVPVIAERVP